MSGGDTDCDFVKYWFKNHIHHAWLVSCDAVASTFIAHICHSFKTARSHLPQLQCLYLCHFFDRHHPRFVFLLPCCSAVKWLLSLLRLSPPLKVPSMSEVSLKVAFISHNMQIRQLLQEADDSLLYIRPDVGMRFGLLDYHKMTSIVECGTVAAKAVLGRWEERQKKRLFRQLRRTARQYAHAHAAAAAAVYRGQRAVGGRGGAGGVAGRILQNIGADTPTAVMVRAGSAGQLAAARGPLLPPVSTTAGVNGFAPGPGFGGPGSKGAHGSSALSGGSGPRTGTFGGGGGASTGPRVGTLLAAINAPASSSSPQNASASAYAGPVGGIPLPGLPHALSGTGSSGSQSSGHSHGDGAGTGGVMRVLSNTSSVASGHITAGDSTNGSPWLPGSPERNAGGAAGQQQHDSGHGGHPRHGSLSVADSPLSAHGRAAAALSAGLALHPSSAASTVSAAPGLAHLRIPGGGSGPATASHGSVASVAGGVGGGIVLPARTSPFFVPAAGAGTGHGNGNGMASSGFGSGSGGNTSSGAAGTPLHSHIVAASAANGTATPFLMAVDSSALAGIPPLAQLTPAVAPGSGTLGPQALAASLAAGASLAAARREVDDEEGPPSI